MRWLLLELGVVADIRRRCEAADLGECMVGWDGPTAYVDIGCSTVDIRVCSLVIKLLPSPAYTLSDSSNSSRLIICNAVGAIVLVVFLNC